jgi:hypothetical protein
VPQQWGHVGLIMVNIFFLSNLVLQHIRYRTLNQTRTEFKIVGKEKCPLKVYYKKVLYSSSLPILSYYTIIVHYYVRYVLNGEYNKNTLLHLLSNCIFVINWL